MNGCSGPRCQLAFVLLAALLVIPAVWALLGRPVAMPASPLARGEKLDCMSYAPYGPDQSPFDPATIISSEQVAADLTRISALSNCVRTYGAASPGHRHVPEIAARLGMSVMQGIWLGNNPKDNRLEIEAALKLAKGHPQTIRSIIAGNEVLLRGDLSESQLIEIIREVNARTELPVTYADVWAFWERYPRVATAVDFVTIHILPYWEDEPVAASGAAQHVLATHRTLSAMFPGKELIVGEVGWPSAGRMREASLPSRSNLALVLHDVVRATREAGIRTNIIEAYDQPWKRKPEGTVGGYWGMIDRYDNSAKFAWGQAVSDHPEWFWMAVFGLVQAGLVAGTAFVALGRQTTASARAILSVGLIAIVGGLVAGPCLLAIQDAMAGPAGLLRTVLYALPAVVPVLAAAVLMRGLPVPSFSQVLNPLRVSLSIEWLLGVAAIVTAIACLHAGISFYWEGRYLDFPNASLWSGIVPLVLIAIAMPRGRGSFDPAQVLTALALSAVAAVLVSIEGFANWQALLLAFAFVTLAGVQVLIPYAPAEEPTGLRQVPTS